MKVWETRGRSLLLVACAGMGLGLGFERDAAAQCVVTDVYSGGFRHVATGAATLEPLAGRRLAVHNLGSSGEDGVEVKLRSVWGGGVSVDVDEVLAAGGSGLATGIRIRPKGWDGTVKGNLRVSAGAVPGELIIEHAESTIGTDHFVYRLYDSTGNVLDTGTVASSIAAFTCTPITGGLPGVTSTAMAIERKGPPGQHRSSMRFTGGPGAVALQCTVSGLASAPVPGVHTIEFESIGSTDDGRTQSIDIDADDLTDLIVGDPHIASLNVPCPPWDCASSFDDHAISGIGGATIKDFCAGEVCDGTDPEKHIVLVDNLGSSGQDGVSVDFGPVGDGSGLQLGRSGNCCRGHVIIMKLYDDANTENMRVICYSVNAIPWTEKLTCDATATPGAVEMEVVVYSSGSGGGGGGSSIYDPNFDFTPTAVRVFSGLTIDVDVLNPCSNGSWVKVPGGTGQWWQDAVYRCESTMDFLLPSGEILSGNAIAIRPVLNPATIPPRVRRVEMTSDYGGSLYVDDIPLASPPQCVSDVDDGTFTGTPDGGTTIDDLLYFLSRFNLGC
ncbi:MAG: hypothetical protein AB7Q00_11400 [Phycisphaerales bacterium]